MTKNDSVSYCGELADDSWKRVSYESMPYYLLGEISGSVIAGLFGAFNAWTQKNLEISAKEESGFYAGPKTTSVIDDNSRTPSMAF